MEDDKPSPTEGVLGAEGQVVESETAEIPGGSSANSSEENLSTTPQEDVDSRQVGTEEVDKLTTATAAVKLKDKDKINILLKAVGDAPILKQKLWSVPADREVAQIIEFVKKYLKLEKHQSLFLFVNQAFAPSPDQPLRELYECFGSDGKIVLHYSTTYAWG